MKPLRRKNNVLSYRLLLFLIIPFMGCHDDNEPITELESLDCLLTLDQLVDAEIDPLCISNLSEFVIIQRRTLGNLDTNFVETYTIDHCGKVLNEIHTDYAFQNSSYESSFVYDDNGRVIKEFRNGVIYRYVHWQEERALVFDKSCKIISQFTFDNGRITKHIFSENLQPYTFTLMYNADQNLISIADDIITGTQYEYLDYNLDVENPFYQLNSINILRFDDLPFVKYIHNKEKRNEHQISDVFYPERYYDLTYEIDSEGRIIKLDNAKYYFNHYFIYD